MKTIGRNPDGSVITAEQSTKQQTELPRGWLISCPACGATWKVGKAEIGTGRWQICPVCVDTNSRKTG